MEKTREELVQMSHEELEALVLHLQEDNKSMKEKVAQHRDLQLYYFNQTKQMEQRLELLLGLLESWGVRK